MPVTEFECAIAKSQIGRYINGEKLGQAVVDQLESHIAACPRCKLVLEEKRSSLMSTIEADRQERIRAAIDPIPMTSVPGNSAPQLDSPRPETFGALARKFAEPVEGDPKTELRRQLEALADKRTRQIEIPVVAPAFAHKEQTETVTLQLTTEEPVGKKNLMQAFALFKRTNESEAENAPANPTNPAHDATMKKPLAYMAGLTTVVIAMSLIAKNPTAMFGPKANDTRVVASAPAAAAKPRSEAAQKFAAIREKSKKAQAAKVAALKKKAAAQAAAKQTPIAQKPVAKKAAPSAPVAAKVKPTMPANIARVTTKRRTSAQRFKGSSKAIRRTTPRAPDNGTVKIYAPN
ncbi:MAG: hypothetical protein WCK51_03790 [Armatimonadota bacterium]